MFFFYKGIVKSTKKFLVIAKLKFVFKTPLLNLFMRNISGLYFLYIYTAKPLVLCSLFYVSYYLSKINIFLSRDFNFRKKEAVLRKVSTCSLFNHNIMSIKIRIAFSNLRNQSFFNITNKYRSNYSYYIISAAALHSIALNTP